MVSNISQKEFEIFSKIPVVGRIFSKGQENVELTQKLSLLIDKNLDLVSETDSLVKNILSEEDYDFYSRWGSMKLLLNEIYEDLSFLESEFEDSNTLFSTLLLKKLSKEELSQLRGSILQYRELAEHLDSILGMENPKKYLILFQDDEELRPTGGFINSIMIVEASNGKIVSKTFHSPPLWLFFQN